MWPFSRHKKLKLTLRAIAALKANVAGPDSQASLTLSPADTPVLRDLGQQLLVAYLVDLGNSFQWVQQRDLQREGIDSEQLHAIGIENLGRLAQSMRVTPYGNIYAVFLDGNFEASLILLDPLWDESFRKFVPGQYAVAIPARDMLSFCDATSVVGLQELRAVINRLATAGADHPISNHIYVRREKNWEILEGV